MAAPQRMYPEYPALEGDEARGWPSERPKQYVVPVGGYELGELPKQYVMPVSNYELFEPSRPALRLGYAPSAPAYYEQQDSFLCNWPVDCGAAYAPFGHSFLNVQPPPPTYRPAEPEIAFGPQGRPYSPKIEPPKPADLFVKQEAAPLSDVNVKKRIVAEVKPMRPSYSDILSKTPKNGNPPEIPIKKPFPVKDNPKINPVKPNVSKYDKTQNFNSNTEKLSDEKPKKIETDKRKTVSSQTSSGSDSGENNVEAPIKTKQYTNKKNPDENPNKRWISFEDLANDSCNANVKCEQNYTNCNSEFVLIDRGEEEKSAKKKSSKKPSNTKSSEKNELKVEEIVDNSEEFDNIVYQEQNAEVEKSKKKNKEARANVKSAGKNNSDKNKKNTQYKAKKSKNNEYFALFQTYINNWIAFLLSCLFWFFHLVSDVAQMSAHLSADLFSSLCTEIFIRTQAGFTLVKEKATSTQWLYNAGNYIDNKLGHTFVGFWRKLKWFKMDAKKESESDYQKKNHTNIPLPSTGEEAMKRLLACKGKDPYSILGVGVQCSDDDIKRYYRRQAFLVHPDKNQQPGAEEAFKILQHAFDMIGEPERREAYEQTVLETRHAEAARNELADLVARLQEKVRRAASTIRCSGCSNRHARTPTNRASYAARYCSQCHIHHSAKEGDIWAESSCWGLIWMYYACMDGAVYQITQWASCQKKNLKHLKANTHHVQYRIVLGNKPQQGSAAKNQNNNINDADLEDFLNNLYTKSSQSTTGPTPGKTMPGANMQTGETVRNKRKSKKSK